MRTTRVESALLKAIADGRCSALPCEPGTAVGDVLVLTDGTTQTVRRVTYVASGVASLGFASGGVTGVVSCGIDPGFAKTGVCFLRRNPETDEPEVLHLQLVETSKDRDLGAGEDDLRRIALFRSAVEPLVRWFAPSIVSVEQYMVFDTAGVDDLRRAADDLVGLFTGVSSSQEMGRAFGNPQVALRALEALKQMRAVGTGFSAQRGRGAAAKTVGVYHVLSDLGARLEIPVVTQPPISLKVAATGKKSASKQEIEEAMCSKVKGLREALDRHPKTKREHLADAAGHAYIGLDKYRKLLKGIGIDR